MIWLMLISKLLLAVSAFNSCGVARKRDIIIVSKKIDRIMVVSRIWETLGDTSSLETHILSPQHWVFCILQEG